MNSSQVQYAFDETLGILTPLVSGYERLPSSGQSFPATTDPISDGWTSVETSYSGPGFNAPVEIFQQPGSNKLYSFVSHGSQALYPQEELRAGTVPDSANNLSSFNLADYAVVAVENAAANRLYGGSGKDQVLGRGNDDEVWAEAGDDYVRGGSGNDYVDGGLGGDTIYGDEGQDIIFGAAGDDTIDGGSGDDLLSGGVAGFFSVADETHV